MHTFCGCHSYWTSGAATGCLHFPGDICNGGPTTVPSPVTSCFTHHEAGDLERGSCSRWLLFEGGLWSNSGLEERCHWIEFAILYLVLYRRHRHLCRRAEVWLSGIESTSCFRTRDLESRCCGMRILIGFLGNPSLSLSMTVVLRPRSVTR